MNPYIPLPRVPLLANRHEVVLERCRGKRVLHLGCVDTGLLEERFPRGELMHQRLAAVASDLWGVDVDDAGLSFLRSKGFSQLFTGDVCRLHEMPELRGASFDVVVASEVVEHLLNPGLFLEAVQSVMGPDTDLFITVPNAFRVSTLLWLFRGVEYVHPDHNYWFSYHTARNLVEKCGLRVAEVLVYSFQPFTLLPRSVRSAGPAPGSSSSSPPPPPALRRALGYLKSFPRRLLVTILYRTTPFWGDGLILIARRETSPRSGGGGGSVKPSHDVPAHGTAGVGRSPTEEGAHA